LQIPEESPIISGLAMSFGLKVGYIPPFFSLSIETKGRFWESKVKFINCKHSFYLKGRAKPIMARRRGNPNWGKPEPIGPVIPVVTSFEQAVKEFKLTPDQYIRSTRLREWARRNKNSKYIPEPLLEAWGFEIESTL
jgi:hypothetical protein